MSEANETNQHPVTEFTIDRSRWSRRGKNGASRMLNCDGNRCCLGFAAQACGVPDRDLDWGTPSGVEGASPESAVFKAKMPWLFEGTYNSSEAYGLMGANDGSRSTITNRLNGDGSEEALEAFIIKTFADHGVTVHFVDGPVAA